MPFTDEQPPTTLPRVCGTWRPFMKGAGSAFTPQSTFSFSSFTWCSREIMPGTCTIF